MDLSVLTGMVRVILDLYLFGVGIS
uniref:Uncharacterized protein n=1 Tax=Tetranychus urticae TaxID=32264 RepID=T1K4I6_TETUR